MALVSVVVYGHKSNYFVRCINSITRQSYSDVEILVATDDNINDVKELKRVKTIETSDKKYNKWLESILKKTKGRYIIFIKNTSVASSDIFEQMIAVNRDELNYVACPVLYWDGEGYVFPQNNKDTIEGKLFRVERIAEIISSYDGDITWEELIVSSATLFESYDFCKSGCIYNSDIKDLDKKPIKRKEAERVDVWLSQLINMSQEDRWDYIKRWLFYNSSKNEEEIIANVLKIVEIFSDDKETCFRLLEEYIKNWHEDVLKLKDEKKYNAIKKYFSLLPTDERLKEVLITKMEISNRQFECLMDCTMSDYLFYFDKI